MTPEELLRDAFEARTDRVEIGPAALDTIRTRIAGRGRQRRWRLAGLAGAAVAATAAVVIAVVGGAPVGPVPPPVATSGAVPTASTGPTAAPGVAVRVPVYFVGRTAAVLYREYRESVVPADTMADRIAGAVGVAVGGRPLDPDYASWWPAGVRVAGVSVAGGVASVDLTGVDSAGGLPTAADPGFARASVQQLVYTVTAVGVVDGKATITGVRLLFDGVPRAAVWGIPVAGTLVRDNAIQAPLWLISPQQDEVVATTFNVQLDGAVFEAAARLRVRESDGGVRSDQAVLLGAGAPARGEATVRLTLPPGSYTIEVYAVGEPDGREIALDGHRITVR